jgi:diguanylate cyclase (GGDEF)-like protein
VSVPADPGPQEAAAASARDRAYYRFARQLLLSAEGAGVCQLIVSGMAAAVGATQGTLAIYLAEEDAMAIVATVGHPSVLVSHLRIRPGEGVLGRVFATGRAESGRVPRPPEPSSRQRRYRSDAYLAVPLPGPDGVLGVVSLTEPADDRPFTRQQLAVVRAYAVPAALALGRESLRDRSVSLAHLATVDALTGLANRRHFDERLAQEVPRAQRGRANLALLMIDIDDFKILNDTRGHLSGDLVLKEVADILRRSVRGFDVCARYGGEEFAILMPGATASTACQIAERIRRQTELHFVDSWRFGGTGRPTLSIGVSSSQGELTGEALVATADAALLGAKAAGKNIVRLYGDGEAAGAAR